MPEAALTASLLIIFSLFLWSRISLCTAVCSPHPSPRSPNLLWNAGSGGDAGCPDPSLTRFPIFFHRWFRYHVGQTLFHVVQVVLGYMVMLAVMSYNAWIFLGAIAGSTLGYFMVYPLLGRG